MDASSTVRVDSRKLGSGSVCRLKRRGGYAQLEARDWLGERTEFVEDSPSKRSNFVIFGAHVIVYSKDVAADRVFFREVLGFSSVKSHEVV